MTLNKNNIDNLKLKIKEKTCVQYAIEEIALILSTLQCKFGIEEFSDVEFYAQFHKNEKQDFIDATKSGITNI